MIDYKTLTIGELGTNCYLVWESESKKCLIIDPAENGSDIAEMIQILQLKPVGIVATHGHFDHTMGVFDLKLIFNVPFYCSEKDRFLLERQVKTAEHFLKKTIKVPNYSQIDVDLDKIDCIELGKSRLQIIRTPGHTPGGVCLYDEESKILFSGDTIFAGARGDTNHQYSSKKLIFGSVCELMKLPEDVKILPGHGEETTVGREKVRYNTK